MPGKVYSSDECQMLLLDGYRVLCRMAACYHSTTERRRPRRSRRMASAVTIRHRYALYYWERRCSARRLFSQLFRQVATVLHKIRLTFGRTLLLRDHRRMLRPLRLSPFPGLLDGASRLRSRRRWTQEPRRLFLLSYRRTTRQIFDNPTSSSQRSRLFPSRWVARNP